MTREAGTGSLDDAAIVAVDGGVGTGKTSVCTALAVSLGIPYLNGGLLYRALALWCLDAGIRIEDRPAVEAAADSFPVEVSLDSGMTTVFMSGTDVTRGLRSRDVSRAVPLVAAHLGVRQSMTAHQRRIVDAAVERWGGVVIDGRDATTVVAPDARVKILLTVDMAARSLRLESAESSDDAGRRDEIDSRTSELAQAAGDVFLLDTSDVPLDVVIAQIVAHARAILGPPES